MPHHVLPALELICPHGCVSVVGFGLHGTFKVRVDKPLAWEWEVMMPAVPGGNVDRSRNTAAVCLLAKRGNREI